MSHVPPKVRMYCVVSFGGTHASGDPHPRWFDDYEDAWKEVKRRLGVLKLHRRAHGRRQRFNFRPGEGVRAYDGARWRPEWAEDFSLVPESHADFGKAGGLTVYLMNRVEESGGTR